MVKTMLGIAISVSTMVATANLGTPYVPPARVKANQASQIPTQADVASAPISTPPRMRSRHSQRDIT